MHPTVRDERQQVNSAAAEPGADAVAAFSRLVEARRRGNVRAAHDAIRELRRFGFSIVPIMPRAEGFGS